MAKPKLAVDLYDAADDIADPRLSDLMIRSAKEVESLTNENKNLRMYMAPRRTHKDNLDKNGKLKHELAVVICKLRDSLPDEFRGDKVYGSRRIANFLGCLFRVSIQDIKALEISKSVILGHGKIADDVILVDSKRRCDRSGCSKAGKIVKMNHVHDDIISTVTRGTMLTKGR